MEGSEVEPIEVTEGKFYDHGEHAAKEKINPDEINPDDEVQPVENLENPQDEIPIADNPNENILKEPTPEEDEHHGFSIEGSEKNRITENGEEAVEDLKENMFEEKAVESTDKAIGEIPFTGSNIEQIEDVGNKMHFFEEPGNFEPIFTSELNDDLQKEDVPPNNEDLVKEVNYLKVKCQSLESEGMHKDETIKKLRRIVNDHKTDSVTVLQARVNTLIEEKVKVNFECEKLAKLVKELTAKAEAYKKLIDSGESIQKKRDSQLESVVNRTTAMKNEIASLKNDLQKKNLIISNLSTEVTELRPLKDLRSLPEKHSKIVEDLKKTIESKDGEINILKTVIKNLQTTLPSGEIIARSPAKLPPIKGSRTTYSHKNILGAKTGFSVKNHADDYNKSFNIESKIKEDEVKAKQEEDERIKHEEELIKQEIQKKILELESENNERLLMEIEEKLVLELLDDEKENQRITKEREREDIENSLMEIEEQHMKDYEKIITEKLVEEKRILEEKSKKEAEENEKKERENKKQQNAKPKGKVAAKQGAKTGAKKK